jgi:uncharacterized protein YndB with AHSA1/START domain
LNAGLETLVGGARSEPRCVTSAELTLKHPERCNSQVGGREFNRGGPPGGPVYTYSAEFRDIVDEERIVSTSEMLADGTRISVTVATVDFHESGATTQLVLTEQGVFLDGHETAAQREEGTRSLLESLAASLGEDET